MITAALALTLLGACGNSTSSSNKPQAVRSAFRATANQSELQLTLSLQGSPSSFSSNGSSTLTPAQERAILGSQIVLTVEAAKGTTLAHPGTGGELALALTQGGNTLVEIRVAGTPSTLYARVDLAKLTTAYGLDKGRVAQFRSQLQKLGKQVQGLQALDNGQWVSVDLNVLNQFASAAKITLPSAPQLVAGIVGAFFTALPQGANIQPVGTTQAQFAVNVQNLVSALANAIATTPGMSTLSNQVSSLAQRAKNAVPASKSANVTVTVSGGIISKVQLPLNQFDTSHKMTGPASANLGVSKAIPVSAPSGATTINLGQLVQAFEGHAVSS